MTDTLIVPKRTLAQNEDTIRRGMGTFNEVGNALLEIRDAKQYLERGFKSFEDYCAGVWDMQRSQAYRLMDSAKVMGLMSPIGDKPTTEAQVRPLTALPPEKQTEAWEEAVKATPKGQSTTAKIVEKVVNAFRKKSGKKKTQRDDSDGWTKEELEKDAELKAAFAALSILGPDDVKAVRNGTIGLNRAAVIFWSKLPKEKALEIQDLVLGNRWTPQDAVKFTNSYPDENSTVEDLQNYCLATKGKFWTGEFDGFTITIKADRATARRR